VQDKQVKVIQAPRITCASDLTSSIAFTATTPFALADGSPATPTRANLPAAGLGDRQSLLLLAASIGFTGTPVVRGDNSVALTIAAPLRVALQMAPRDDQPAAEGGNGLFTMACRAEPVSLLFQDGQTMAIQGYRVRPVALRGARLLLPADFPRLNVVNDTAAEQDLLVLVTVHVIR
jgi:hypothetical protein